MPDQSSLDRLGSIISWEKKGYKYWFKVKDSYQKRMKFTTTQVLIANEVQPYN